MGFYLSVGDHVIYYNIAAHDMQEVSVAEAPEQILGKTPFWSYW